MWGMGAPSGESPQALFSLDHLHMRASTLTTRQSPCKTIAVFVEQRLQTLDGFCIADACIMLA